MRTLIRSPLAWAVLAEMVVVGALIVVAWEVAGSVGHAGLALPAIAAPGTATPEGDVPLPDIPSAAGPEARGPLPGLNVTSSFWRRRLAQLNGEQAAFEQLEWRIVHAGMVAIRDYVEGVVLPAIRRAERGVGSVA